MRVLLFLLSISFSCGLFAQDFSGRWTGYAMDSSSGKYQKLALNIGSHDSLMTGVVHRYFPATGHFCNFVVSGQFHLDNLGILLFEDSTVNDSTSLPEEKIRGYYKFYYKQSHGKEMLEGYWYSYQLNGVVQRIKIDLERKTGKFIPLPIIKHHPHEDSVLTVNDQINNRNSPLVARITVQEDSVQIKLYDNGEIDGDSVSLYLNGVQILQHLKLEESAKILYLPLDRSLPVNKLVLVAENLGAMPPNTALMEIVTRQKTYYVYLSTDYKKNAMVEFIFKQTE